MRNIVEKVINRHGAPKIASVCGVSAAAVYRWRRNDRLPRTDITGETRYAEAIEGIESVSGLADALRAHTRERLAGRG